MSLYAMTYEEFAEHMDEAGADLAHDDNITTGTLIFIDRLTLAGRYDHAFGLADLPFC